MHDTTLNKFDNILSVIIACIALGSISVLALREIAYANAWTQREYINIKLIFIHVESTRTLCVKVTRETMHIAAYTFINCIYYCIFVNLVLFCNINHGNNNILQLHNVIALVIWFIFYIHHQI